MDKPKIETIAKGEVITKAEKREYLQGILEIQKQMVEKLEQEISEIEKELQDDTEEL